MDLRTIMNTDGGAANPPPSNSASSPISDQTPQKHANNVNSYSEYPTRPPQPPSLQPQHASPERSSSYASAQSPYQHFSSGPEINTAVGPQRSQTPPHVSTPYGSGSRDPFGAPAYGSHPQHPGGPLVSPYTPQPLSAGPQHPEQQSYFAQQRSQQRSQSLQSVVTNPRAPTESFRSPPVASQPLPSQQFSPSAHQSVPGAPLGPPPSFASRQSPSIARPPSPGRNSPRNPLSSPRPAQEAQLRDQAPTQSPVTQRQFSPRRSRPSEPTHHSSLAGLNQETTESASPQSVSRHNSTIAAPVSAPAGPARSSEDRMSLESPVAQKPTRAVDFSTSPMAPGSHTNSSPSGVRGGPHALKMEIDQGTRAEPEQPRQKRRRYNEPPVYARLTPRKTNKRPIIPNPQPPIPRHARQELWTARRRSSSTMAVTPTARVNRAPPVPSPRTSVPPVQAPPASLIPPSSNSQTIGSLGPWEPSITGYIPHEEITKILCDFLFQHVVLRNDVNVASAGSAAAGQGTIVEIEAKLGHIIDLDSRDRIQLPILTESVINRENGRFRTSFESNMTVEQHRAMNNFLNEAVKASMPQNNPNRIPLAYVHKKERDTFYEIQAADLPPVIRQNLNPRHKPKVRVTTDERTGEVLAKIVKCRVADVDVCSPRTTVDWRVSVNLEMEYTGDVSNLTMIDTAVTKGGRGDRIKDRMSYRHLAYQVDLTQVAKSDVSSCSKVPACVTVKTSLLTAQQQQPGKPEFDHELEVEVSAAEIRRQGQLALSGDPKNQYEDLVKGFVDNIRLLARAVPS
ncbi:hypothetical protein N7535_005739 [Penicillium sp. DV-2018c]|nr:hypothetical protein N7461_009314 [Penicillium sp. DV-2018c]KAJ5572079.1 hypothetical protein N7535_005739 [Penicillium sp. DV-2018c]